MMVEPILELRSLSVHYGPLSRPAKAVDGVGLALRRGSILALVGESGCGKSTVAMAILGLLPDPGRVVDGEVLFEGQDLLSLEDRELRRVRGREISLISQDPAAGLNPVLSVGEQVDEIVRAHHDVSRKEARQVALAALDQAGLPRPEQLVRRYPYQLSGGMSQRVAIAMATALAPKVIIADEPTSALDVTVQAGILRELERLREDGASVLLITHNFGVVAQLADELAVMYAGRIVEEGAPADVLSRPRHPYTWSLLGTLPRIDGARRPLDSIKGTPPDPRELPDECAFLPRCRKAVNDCRAMPAPPLAETVPGHRVACYNPVVHLGE